MQYLDLRKGDKIDGKTITLVTLEAPHVVITFDDGTKKVTNPFGVVRGGVARSTGGAR